MSNQFTETVIEDAALEWLGELGYRVIHGPEVAPGEAAGERDVKVLGDDTLETIARELVETIRRSATIDWTVKESVRARLRVIVKRIFRKYGYPPDKQEAATLTALQQTELLSEYWTEGPRA